MRALLEQSGCPSAFWALARLYFCELTNVLPNNRATELWKAMGHSGPCSAIGLLRKTGRVSAWWARPFGCRCYYTAPGDAKLGGVVRRGNPGIFVGLAKHFNSKGYLVYVPGRTDLVISQDVTFFPEEFPFRENAIEWDEQTRRGKWASGSSFEAAPPVLADGFDVDPLSVLLRKSYSPAMAYNSFQKIAKV